MPRRSATRKKCARRSRDRNSTPPGPQDAPGSIPVASRSPGAAPSADRDAAAHPAQIQAGVGPHQAPRLGLFGDEGRHERQVGRRPRGALIPKRANRPEGERDRVATVRLEASHRVPEDRFGRARGQQPQVRRPPWRPTASRRVASARRRPTRRFTVPRPSRQTRPGLRASRSNATGCPHPAVPAGWPSCVPPVRDSRDSALIGQAPRWTPGRPILARCGVGPAAVRRTANARTPHPTVTGEISPFGESRGKRLPGPGPRYRVFWPSSMAPLARCVVPLTLMMPSQPPAPGSTWAAHRPL